MSGFQLDTAELVGTLVETLLYGSALVLGSKTIGTLFESSRRSTISVNPLFIVTAWTLMVLATMHLAVDWHRIFAAFLQSQSQGERIVFLANIRNWSYVFKDTVYVVQTTLGDSILVYRCFVIWGRNPWIALVPLLCTLTSLAFGLAAIGSFFGAEDIFLGRVKTFITVIWVTTVTTNLLATGLILFRLWLSERSRKAMFASISLMPIITVVLESGAIYCVACIVGFALFEAGSNAQIIVLNGLTSLIVILFSFVLLGISRPLSFTGTHSIDTHSLPTNLRSRRSQMAPRATPVEVSISHYVEMSPLPEDPIGTKESPKSGYASHISSFENHWDNDRSSPS